jgi:hypothetical protein
MPGIMCLGLIAFAGFVAAGPVLADCASDVAVLDRRVARETDPAKSAAAKKQLIRAHENLKGSETECLNAVTRTYRILNASAAPQPLPAGTAPTTPAPGKPWNSIK